MEKKKYSKPVVVAERFEPQEYCATCVGPDGTKITDIPGSAYIDFNNDGLCQANEHVTTTGTTSYPVDGRYDLDIYQFQSDFSGWSEAVGVFSEAPGHQYGTRWGWGIHYRLHKEGSRKFILYQGQLYKNLS